MLIFIDITTNILLVQKEQPKNAQEATENPQNQNEHIPSEDKEAEFTQ